MDHDDTRWRFFKQRSIDGHSTLWVLESDLRKCMAIMELHHVSQWHKDRHPDWENEFNNDVKQIQANANLIESAPEMLNALIKAQNGDLSQIQYAIDRATGKINWLGSHLDENGNVTDTN